MSKLALRESSPEEFENIKVNTTSEPLESEDAAEHSTEFKNLTHDNNASRPPLVTMKTIDKPKKRVSFSIQEDENEGTKKQKLESDEWQQAEILPDTDNSTVILDTRVRVQASPHREKDIGSMVTTESHRDIETEQEADIKTQAQINIDASPSRESVSDEKENVFIDITNFKMGLGTALSKISNQNLDLIDWLQSIQNPERRYQSYLDIGLQLKHYGIPTKEITRTYLKLAEKPFVILDKLPDETIEQFIYCESERTTAVSGGATTLKINTWAPSVTGPDRTGTIFSENTDNYQDYRMSPDEDNSCNDSDESSKRGEPSYGGVDNDGSIGQSQKTELTMKKGRPFTIRGRGRGRDRFSTSRDLRKSCLYCGNRRQSRPNIHLSAKRSTEGGSVQKAAHKQKYLANVFPDHWISRYSESYIRRHHRKIAVMYWRQLLEGLKNWFKSPFVSSMSSASWTVTTVSSPTVVSSIFPSRHHSSCSWSITTVKSPSVSSISLSRPHSSGNWSVTTVKSPSVSKVYSFRPPSSGRWSVTTGHPSSVSPILNRAPDANNWTVLF